jgi:Glycosyl hydrolase family 9./N-terminal ig-like domain of cellulase.
MKDAFSKSIMKSNILHRPLEDIQQQSFETYSRKKKVLKRRELYSVNTTDLQKNWQHHASGEMKIATNGEVVITSPTTMKNWPDGAPDDGDYSNYGPVKASYKVMRENWGNYNRLTFEIYADCPGAVNPHVTVFFKNDGAIKIPDLYDREGYHVANLKNNEWNTCSIEISDLPRDEIIEFGFSYCMLGQDRVTLDYQTYKIRQVVLEKVEKPSLSKGWIPKSYDIILSHNGYQMDSNKIAILAKNDNKIFAVMNAVDDSCVLEKAISANKTSIGEFSLCDFSEITDIGDYYLKVGDQKSITFKVGPYAERWQQSTWKALNFVFCERCGCPIHEKHGSCHEDILAEHQGKKIIYNGGWHDAGDVSQQTLQSSEITLALFEFAETIKDKDEQLYLRLLEEAEWGFDFLLKTRFGDGYRATSAGICIWSNGLIGDMDDMKARVHNLPYDNFFHAALEAKIAQLLPSDSRLKPMAEKIAQEDFAFALEEFAKIGYKYEPIFWEHTYNTSESLYDATIVWAAAELFKLTGNSEYENYIEKHFTALLMSQEQTGLALFNGGKAQGFFYRNKEKKSIQHFNHQAREHLYAVAMVGALEASPQNVNAAKWLKALTLYNNYFKFLAKYAYPYPMLPSGVYLENEPDDKYEFSKQHLLTGSEINTDYKAQLLEGEHIGERLYLKRFPVWFSFRGNNGVVLSMGMSAATIGRYLQDKETLAIAEGQLQWVVGMNPFNQSMMYGEGVNYALQYTVLSGEMVGELPVGVQTFANEDVPYWSQLNNATYKEVWVGLAGRWFSILKELNQF